MSFYQEVKNIITFSCRFYVIVLQIHDITPRLKTQSFLPPLGMLKWLQEAVFVDMDELGLFLFMEEQERKENEQQEEKDDGTITQG